LVFYIILQVPVFLKAVWYWGMATPYPYLVITFNIKRTIFKKARTETILKLYNTLILPTFLYGSENLTLTALQRRRIEAAEMKLLRPLAGYTLYDHKTNDYIRCELRITSILDKIDEYRRNWLSHLQRMPQKRIRLKSYHYRPQGRRTIGRRKNQIFRYCCVIEWYLHLLFRPKKRCHEQL